MSNLPVSNDFFLKVSKPSRYLGREFNSVIKKWEENRVKFALIFPEPYEIGMSHLGFQILYSILNRSEDVICERSFLPWIDMQKLLKEKKIPMFSLESRRPLTEFDILGFSLQYEMSFTNIIAMFRLSGIPPLARERDDKMPLVVGGGPCAFNPEPLAPFFDAFLIGEGEEAVTELIESYLNWKNSGSKNKDVLLDKLSSIEGFYIPSFFEPKTDRLTGCQYLQPLKPGYKNVRKRVLSRLKTDYLPQCPIVPFMKIIHDRVSIEIQRGCTKGCRFCQAGMIYRPTRQRKASEIINYAFKTQKETGYEDISFLSLNSSDHPSLKQIFSTLSEYYRGNSIAFSLPSTRLDEFDEDIMKNILSLRKTGYTFAPEAGSERLRFAINKPISDAEILQNLETIFKSGWNLVKLYFMIGLPTETMDDVNSIVLLTKKIAQTARAISKRNRLNINISPFVPKPHTPYQWFGQESIESLQNKIDYLKKELKSPAINIKWHEPALSVIETLISRGNRSLSRLLLKCHESGAILDAWSDTFNFGIWVNSAKSIGLNLSDAVTKEIGKDYPLPWEVIQSGVEKKYLLSELGKTYKGETTADCAFDSCNLCGLCDDNLKPQLDDAITVNFKQEHKKTQLSKNHIPLLIHFQKKDFASLLSHLEMVKVFERTFRRADISLKVSEGYHPKPMLKFSRALPTGIESEDERLLVYLDSSQKDINLKERLNLNLPEGLIILSTRFSTGRTFDKELNQSVSSYIARMNGRNVSLEAIEKAIDLFHKIPSFRIIKRTKKGSREIDLKDIIMDIKLKVDSIFLKFDEKKPQINPLEAIGKIIGKELIFGEDISIKKVKTDDYGN